MYASRLDSTFVLDELLSAQIPPRADLVDFEGQAALHHACSVGAVEAALTLLAYLGPGIATTRDNKGHSPLDCAFGNGHDEVYAVLQECADLTLPDRLEPPVQDKSCTRNIRFMWTATLNMQEYKIQRSHHSLGQDAVWRTVLKHSKVNSFTDKTAAVGETYVYRVAAANCYGWGPFSRPSGFMRADATSDRSALPSNGMAASVPAAVKDLLSRTGSRVINQKPISSETLPKVEPWAAMSSAQVQQHGKSTETDHIAAVAASLQLDLADVKLKLKKARSVMKQFGLPDKYVKELSVLELRQVEQSLLVAAQRISDERVKRSVSSTNGQQKECAICLGELKTVVLLPCKHLCLCDTCATALLQRASEGREGLAAVCPVCRQPVTDHVRVFR